MYTFCYINVHGTLRGHMRMDDRLGLGPVKVYVLL